MKMKKLISLTLTLLLIMGTLLVFPANAAKTETKEITITGGTLTYSELADGGIKIEEFRSSGATTEIVLPDEIDGKPVTEIGSFALSGNITKLTLPNKLTKIGACGICGEMESLELPESLTELGKLSLAECEELTKLDLSNIEKIGKEAFYGCKSLKSIKFSDKLTVIGKKAFSNCNSLKTLNLPKNLKTVKGTLFDGFYNTIKAINVDSENPCFASKDGVLFDKNMTELLEYPMAKPDKTYKVPNSVTKLGNHAFFWTEKLEMLTLSNNIKTLERGAIGFCQSLKVLDFGNGMKTWDNQFFVGCSKLEKVVIGKSLKKINSTAVFRTGLQGKDTKSYAVRKANKYFTAKDGVLYNKTFTRLYRYPIGKKGTKFTVPAPVKIIEPYAFSGGNKLKSITLGKKLEKLKEGAFRSTLFLKKINFPPKLKAIPDYCFSDTGLEQVKIPKNIKTIGVQAFDLSYYLSKVVLSEGIKTIKDEAFLNCNKFAAVRIPKSVTKIGEHAFGYREDWDTYFEDDREPVHYYILRHSYKIKGYKNTEAQRYAKDNNIEFEEIK